MRKLLILTLLVLLLALPGLAAAKQGGLWLRVTGLVDQPLRLSLADLSRLASARVKYNDVTSNGKFRGVFWLQGVPLRSLLELAQVNKPSGGFSKRVDLAYWCAAGTGDKWPCLGGRCSTATRPRRCWRWQPSR